MVVHSTQLLGFHFDRDSDCFSKYCEPFFHLFALDVQSWKDTDYVFLGLSDKQTSGKTLISDVSGRLFITEFNCQEQTLAADIRDDLWICLPPFAHTTEGKVAHFYNICGDVVVE